MAAALEKAATAAAGGLHIRSCKLAGASLDIPAVLQALPASSLTSLVLEMRIPEAAAASDIHALINRLSTVLPSLQQLQQLYLHDPGFFDRSINYSPVLSGFGALTNLQHLVLPQVTKCLGCSRVVEVTCSLGIACSTRLQLVALLSILLFLMSITPCRCVPETVGYHCLAKGAPVRLCAACIWQ
jgi:hypothetical protein